jgi:hypothetical protein
LLNYLILYKYDTASKKLITWMNMPWTDPAKIAAIAFSKEGNIIWIHNGMSLYKIFPLKKNIIKQETMPYQAAVMWADGSSYLWISFYSKNLCRYNITTAKKDWFALPFRNIGKRTIDYAVALCFAREKNREIMDWYCGWRIMVFR